MSADSSSSPPPRRPYRVRMIGSLAARWAAVDIAKYGGPPQMAPMVRLAAPPATPAEGADAETSPPKP